MNKTQEKFEAIDKCPVCESSSHQSYKKSTFDYLSLNQEQIKITDKDYGKIWDLSRCDSCSHIFASPRPTQDFIQSLYSEVEDPLYQAEAEGREKNFQRIFSYLDNIHPEKGVLFDVGAATGILLNLARERGWQTDGIEASQWAVQIASDYYGLNLQIGYFETAPTPKNHYTVVSLVDFIEHIPDPVAAVKKAFEILESGGTLCLVTPDIKSITARVTGKKWWHFRPAHLSYFTKKSLLTLLYNSGFQIIKIRRYSWTFSAHYLISRVPRLKFLLKNARLASFWKKLPIKLTLGDSFEIYARKEN